MLAENASDFRVGSRSCPSSIIRKADGTFLASAIGLHPPSGWEAQPRTTPGGQRHYSNLAIETALTLRAVFRLALRQSEGLIGSIMRMLEIDLPVPDHTTLSRRACGLPVQLPWRNKTSDLHLIVDSTGLDSTGLKLRGAGEWLFEKHGTAKRRAWRKLHIGIDADSGEIVAFDLSHKDVDDASHVPTLLDQLTQAPASFMADGAYDRTATYDAILARNSFARYIVPPRKGAVPGPTATISPTQRDRHIRWVEDLERGSRRLRGLLLHRARAVVRTEPSKTDPNRHRANSGDLIRVTFSEPKACPLL